MKEILYQHEVEIKKLLDGFINQNDNPPSDVDDFLEFESAYRRVYMDDFIISWDDVDGD